MPGPPDLETLLAQWWGGGIQNNWAAAFAAIASNVIVGGNGVYQISDFFAFYPKFGTQPQAIMEIALNDGGSGYTANDVLTVVQSGGAGGLLTVDTVDGSGAITAFKALDGAGVGTGYSVATGLTVTGGTGTGALVDITAITKYTSLIPQPVVLAYITLALASLQKNRWQDHWALAVGLFVAHFCTLYLRSEGAVGSTAQQIAASGIEKGLTVGKAAGDVSQSLQALDDLDGWAVWRETTYGVQLATFAKTIAGPLTSYVY